MSARRGERGMSVSVEMAILVPALVLIIALVTGGGRLALARINVQQWADSAARSATLARAGHEARERAATVVASDAAASDTRCSGPPDVSADVSAFAHPVGVAGSVVVTVRCHVPLADLLLPGVPGTVTVERDATSPLDRYRGRR
ncbi:MAG: pilus assembly protein [Propionibacteriaceae bacterium]|nr:pilus assembly protein [Propionibacteriaceae bacterium]